MNRMSMTARELPIFRESERYRIISWIGSGGIGSTYRAIDTKQNQEVVIKIIESEKIWDRIIKKRERILACPSEHMPKIFDVLNLDKYHCLIEEMIDGESLYQIVSQNILTFRDFFSIFRDMVCALISLHGYNLVHGDIKPGNVVLKKHSTGFEAYLIDIDSAFLHDFDDFAFLSKGINETFFGTLLYASPEEILENSFSGYSDVYSLGILMYYVLQNRIPFSADKDGMMDKIHGDVDYSLKDVKQVSFKEDLQKWIQDMTNVKEWQRPTIHDILQKIEIWKHDAEKNQELDQELRFQTSAMDYADILKMESIYSYSAVLDTSVNPWDAILDTSVISLDDLEIHDWNTPLEEDAPENEEKKPKSVPKDEDRKKENGVSEEKYVKYKISERNTPIRYREKKRENKSKTTVLRGRTIPVLMSQAHTQENFYRKQLIKEYEQINKQAVVSFWLWVFTFVFGFVIIAVAVTLTVRGQYMEALTTVILEALVYFVQRLFAIREDDYRKLNSDKLKHLETGDYLDYMKEIAYNTAREEYKEKRIDSLLRAVEKQMKNNK